MEGHVRMFQFLETGLKGQTTKNKARSRAPVCIMLNPCKSSFHFRYSALASGAG